MSRISKVDEKLRELEKPSLSITNCPNLGTGDVLILAAGFEDRAMEILNRLIAQKRFGFSVVAFEYEPILAHNKLEEISRVCQGNAIQFSIVKYDRRNPSGAGDSVWKIIGQVKGLIFIDISAMSRLLIVQLVVTSVQNANLLNKTVILYSEALKYPPNETSVREALRKKTEGTFYRALLLSWGVYEVISVPELASISFPGQPTRLVVFPAFNSDQLSALLAEVQPHSISVIHGIPPLAENRWRLEAIKDFNCIDSCYKEKCEEISVSTLDYRELTQALLNLYSKNSLLEKIVIAPTGSKMQALAVGLVKGFCDDIQIIYPIPRSFASPGEYTEGVRNVYELPLFQFSGLAENE